jgi:hypothetical protein
MTRNHKDHIKTSSCHNSTEQEQAHTCFIPLPDAASHQAAPLAPLCAAAACVVLHEHPANKKISVSERQTLP